MELKVHSVTYQDNNAHYTAMYPDMESLQGLSKEELLEVMAIFVKHYHDTIEELSDNFVGSDKTGTATRTWKLQELKEFFEADDSYFVLAQDEEEEDDEEDEDED